MLEKLLYYEVQIFIVFTKTQMMFIKYNIVGTLRLTLEK